MTLEINIVGVVPIPVADGSGPVTTGSNNGLVATDAHADGASKVENVVIKVVYICGEVHTSLDSVVGKYIAKAASKLGISKADVSNITGSCSFVVEGVAIEASIKSFVSESHAIGSGTGSSFVVAEARKMDGIIVISFADRNADSNVSNVNVHGMVET